MGVGKGTLARRMVKMSDYFAVDTDDLIESIEKTEIKKIFAKKGEPYFRKLEKRCALWCEDNVKNTIISTGGGFYKQENIKKIGKVVYLQADFENIIQRLHDAPNSKAKFEKRPLLKDLKEAKKLYKQRIKEYEEVADIIINVQEWNDKRSAKKILKAIKKGK